MPIQRDLLKNNIVYIADPAFRDELCEELGDVTFVTGNLVFSKRHVPDLCFALDAWLAPEIHTIESISQAARLLKQAGKYWVHNPVECIRRSHLIAEKLRKTPELESHFPIQDPLPAIGGFSLLDANTLVFSAQRWKIPPQGNFQFREDKENPPNRAYLKLWEALSLLDTYPKPGETAIDLGASPGGWTYVMQSLGVSVCAVDKAELAPQIAALPGVQFRKQSAFALEPDKLDLGVDWLLSDIACYPERALGLIKQWIDSGKAKQIIVTIKLQGKTDFALLNQFKSIASGRILHLVANKHEVTFFHPAPSQLFIF